VHYYRSKDGDTVDWLVWTHYGRQDGGRVVAVLEANPGLAGYGPVLPAGLLIALPDLPETAETGGVRLWD